MFRPINLESKDSFTTSKKEKEHINTLLQNSINNNTNDILLYKVNYYGNACFYQKCREYFFKHLILYDNIRNVKKLYKLTEIQSNSELLFVLINRMIDDKKIILAQKMMKEAKKRNFIGFKYFEMKERISAIMKKRKRHLF